MNFFYLKPMLLSENTHELGTSGWHYEIKFDGYRLMAECGNGYLRLKTRNGANATKWFPELKGLAELSGGPHVLDGEVCILDETGRSDFGALRTRAKRRSIYPGAPIVTFCVFDLLYQNGRSLIDHPIEDRKSALCALLLPAPPNTLVVKPFDAVTDMRLLFDNVVMPLKLEGLVAKRKGSGYRPGVRSLDWLKVKRTGVLPNIPMGER